MIRRVVVGHESGKAVVLADGVPARSHAFEHTPGFAWSFAWATPVEAVVGDGGPTEPVAADTAIIPRVGETRLVFLHVPPDSWAGRPGFDPVAAATEMAAHQPDIAATFEPDHPGFHRTDSIDYVIVLKGEVLLELDDGNTTVAREHDVIIQAGARHAWHNTTDEPALLAVVLVGATRT